MVGNSTSVAFHYMTDSGGKLRVHTKLLSERLQGKRQIRPTHLSMPTSNRLTDRIRKENPSATAPPLTPQTPILQKENEGRTPIPIAPFVPQD